MSSGNNHKANKDFFENISSVYEIFEGNLAKAIRDHMEIEYCGGLAGKSVLDIGNGGKEPSEVLGEKVADQLGFFVGIDSSAFMLLRKSGSYCKVRGDGMALPFANDSFDYVTVNGIIHHFGFGENESSADRAKIFLTEALRVARKGVIVSEPVTWRIAEWFEKIIFSFLKSSELFMFSWHSLRSIIRDMKLTHPKTSMRTYSQLTHPFDFFPVLMKLPWLRFPAFLSPIKITFFLLTPDAATQNDS